MGRPPLPIGDWGNVSVTGSKGEIKATCRFRDGDGVTRPVERTRSTVGLAKAALLEAVRERQLAIRGGDLTGETTITQLLEAWWDWKLANDHLAIGSRERYADHVRRVIVPGIGSIRLREATTGRLDNWLIAERKIRPSAAAIASTILNQAFSFAAQRNAIVGNPMSVVSKGKKGKSDPRALTVDELSRLRDAVRGMRQNTWLADIFEVQLGLALRIGEVLALQVESLDLDHPNGPRVRIEATVITPTGLPHSRQTHTKDGPEGRRTLIVADHVATILRRRAMLASPTGRLFESRNQTLLSPRNVRSSWRNIRDAAGLDWMKPHHLRKTALSMVHSVFGLEAAARFADHKNSDVTQTFYIEKTENIAPDVRAAIDLLAPPARSVTD